MGCDYYIQSDLVIIYCDNQAVLSSTRTNRILEKGYIFKIPDDDSDDDFETQNKKYKEELKRCIQKNTYKKVLYENDEWLKESYKKRYLQELNLNALCPRMVKIVRIYKDYYAWERN